MFIDPIIMQMDESIDRERFVIATYYCGSQTDHQYDEVRRRPGG